MENDNKKGNGGSGSASPSAAAAAGRGGGGDGGGGGGGSSVMRWERFLPKMALRVLLVDADDSTRQIIAALLRKCSHKVASVPDGLKAWEMLKVQAQNIDLILTEVDLPSISGFALLTLIMEHDICKNIPVIMMSSKDSLSTVYKCMLKGAADFLVKPIRKNELRNLWQHVWRKQALSGGGLVAPEESVAQQNFEATAENNSVSNPSSDSIACGQRNRECIKKESDAQSSCGKPEMATEGPDIECAHNLLQQKGSKSLSNDVNVQQKEGLIASRNVQMPEGPQTAAEDIECQTMTRQEATNVDDHCQQGKFIGQTPDNNHVLDNSCREAMDLIGAFDNNRKCTNGSSSSHINPNNFDPSPSFELSLRRSHPSGSVDQDTDEKFMINPFDASAFSRFIYTKSHPQQSALPSTSKQQKYYETNSASMPMKGISFQNLSNASGPVKPPADYMQSGLSPMQSEYRQEHYLETLENRGYFSSVADQSAAYSSFCDGGVSQLHGINYESKDIVNPVVPVTSEYGKEEAFPTHDGNTHRSLEREAVLSKFRLKRKERCYGKKVRYESRKKLAEQRPRVKGQFVRQAQNEHPTGS